LLCSVCEHDNPEQNRYCGMCGNPLKAVPAEGASPPRHEASSSQGASMPSSSILGLDSEPVRGEPFQREPTISGPSFLGIGAEPECPANKYSYLFDYEQPRSHRGLWVALVLLAAMALVALQFRREIRARALPLYSAVLARVNPQTAAPQARAATSAPADSSATPAQTTTRGVSDVPPSTAVTSDAAQQSPGATPSQPQSKPEEDSVAPKAGDKSEAAESAESDEAVESPPPAKAARRPRKAVYAKPQRPIQSDVSPEDNRLLQLAQKYIHGQGVRADCRTGLAYLREATKHPSSAAASQMGALYATGTCVPLDRVSAYRWFSSALQMAPSNPWLARERDQLYAQMSSTERRMADRQ
jgi:hypothetical protein